MLPYARLLVLVLASACVDLTRPPGLVTTEGDGGGRGGTAGAGATAGGGGSGGHAGEGSGEDGPAADVEPGPDAEPLLDAPLLEIGRRCSEAAQCASGFCADGYCCNDACEGRCQSCGLSGSEGACTAVPAGLDPRSECPQDPVASCGLDGSCNGQGACARYPAETPCAPGRCMDATEYAASTCDGNGVCVAGSSRSCAPNLCTGSSCAASCAAQTDCQTGFFCETSKCVVRRPTGATCSLALQCASGHCVDGYCCDRACTATCQACNVSGKAGTCSDLPDGQDPQNECPAEPVSTCGRAGGCNGAGGCRLHGAGVLCQAATCSGYIESGARSCNGAGVCLAGVNRDCAPYTCSTTTCRTSCSSTSQCRAGNYCSGGACVPFGSGPVLHWRFDESGGTSALDSSGNGYTGTYIGNSGVPSASSNVPAVTFANPASRALVAGSRHAVRLAPAPAAVKPANNMTLSLWFRTSNLDLGHNPPAASEAISQGDNYFIRIRATDVAFTRRAAGTYLSCLAVVNNHLDGRWHHVAAVFSPAGMKVYFDGVERCSNSRGEPGIFDKGPDLFVGRHGNGSADWDVDGNIDDVRIYNRALPAGEAAALAAGF